MRICSIVPYDQLSVFYVPFKNSSYDHEHKGWIFESSTQTKALSTSCEISFDYAVSVLLMLFIYTYYFP